MPETVARRAGNEDLRILMVTREGRFETISEALEAGADEYVIKPFDRDVLQDKLQLVGISAIESSS